MAMVAAGPIVVDGLTKRFSIMPETPGLYQGPTVRENLEFFAGLHGASESRRRIAQALESVGLEQRVDDPCGSLSKGLRQRARWRARC